MVPCMRTASQVLFTNRFFGMYLNSPIDSNVMRNVVLILSWT